MMNPALPRLVLRALILVLGTATLGCSSESTAPLDRLSDGNWGGEHIGVFVDQTGVTFLFDCSGGRVDGSIILDSHGDFDVVGTYSDGGNAQNVDRSPHPARYVGHATRMRVDVTRTILDRSDAGTSFSALRGAPPMIVAC